MLTPSATRYRTTNWSVYNASLRKRGALSVWFDPEMLWHAEKSGKRGRPETFSEAAIQTCLTLKVLFGLPLRQTVGLVESLIRMAGLDWPVPDYSTLCRRQARIAVQVPYRASGQPLNLLIPSRTLLRDILPGSGQHWHQVPRGWRVAGSQAWLITSEAVEEGPYCHGCGHGRCACGRVHVKPPGRQSSAARSARADPAGRADRHGHCPLSADCCAIACRAMDGAYDTRRCHGAIIGRGAEAVIPIRRNGRAWKEDCPAAIARNEILRATRHLGRALWKRWAKYHVRSRVEARMNCLKLFGERIMSRDPDRQTAKIQIRIALMNRFSALGTAEIKAIV